jgi:ubiquitin-conjugating enzyme E2 G1
VYKDGKVCISILHEGIDNWGYEKSCERWTPTHTVDSIMTSIISMLSDPNFESPANTNHSVLWKDKPEQYKKMIYQMVAKTQ